MSSLLAAHVACFQSVCRKRRDSKRRATIEFESFYATANVVVAKVFKARRGFFAVVEKKEEEEEEEEEGTLTLMFPVRFRPIFLRFASSSSRVVARGVFQRSGFQFALMKERYFSFVSLKVFVARKRARADHPYVLSFSRQQENYPKSEVMAIGDGESIDETKLNEALEDEDFTAANKTLFEVLRLAGKTFFRGKELKRIERMIGEAELMAIETDVGLGNEDEEVYRDEFGDAMDVCGGGRNEERTVRLTRMLLQAKQRCKENEERRMQEKQANSTLAKTSNGNNATNEQEQQTNKGSFVDSADLKRAARESIFYGKGIFSSNIAFERLLKEFEDLHRFNGANKFRKYISVESVNDSVYIWDVKFMNFENRDIARDLASVKKKFGYDYVQVRVELKEDLHPYYPPKMTIIRPRLEGIVALATCLHPKFRLKNWLPMTSMTDVLLTARTFLERFARVDVTCPANNKRAFLNGAYDDRASKLDLALCALTCSGETPLIPRVFEELYEKEREMEEEIRGDQQFSSLSPSTTLQAPMMESGNKILDKEMVELNEMLVKQREQESKPTLDHRLKGFHSGVGYSSGNERGKRDLWDSKDAKKAQLAQDKMSSDLVNFAREELAFADRMQSLWRRENIYTEENNDEEDEDLEECAFESARIICVFENASLANFLARELKISDFNNMADRAEYYTSLLECVLIFYKSHIPTLKEGVRAAFEKYDNMRDIVQQANTFLHVTKTVDKVADNKHKERDQEDTVLENLVKLIVQVGTIIDLTNDADPMTTTMKSTTREQNDSSDSRNIKRKKTTTEEDEKNHEKAYCDALSRPGFQFDNFALSDSSHYKSKLLNQGTKPNTHAIARAVAGISGSLPLSLPSSAFVRVDEEQAQLWSILITGPENTPYDSGAFIFDVMLPSDFPNKPPLVNLKTTGGGRVRFNPNLYNCGKVCLSLLGTWSGGEGEGWNAQHSTMLQVIVSIQSLIFVSDPCFNEPGWEKDRGTDIGDKKDFEYNAVIKTATLEWAILDHVRRLNRKMQRENDVAIKDGPFDEVLRAHFLKRRDHILTVLRSKWEREAKENEHAPKGHLEKLEAKFTEVAKELKALK